MSEIHPLACVERGARVGADVRIGPFCYVGAGVELGDRCVLHPHVTLLGPATFGADNEFYSQCTLGAAPQDLKYRGGPTSLVVGAGNTFREGVTVHRGTEVDRVSGGVTRIGDHNLFMVGVHIAHDADIADNIILANGVQIAGHVRLEQYVNVGGASAMHHFVTVGRNAFVGGMTRVTHDVPPYMKVVGYTQQVRGVNVEGMRRWHIDDASITNMRNAARLLYARRGEHSPFRTNEALREIEGNGLIHDVHVQYLVHFLKRKLSIGIFGRAREYERADVPADRASFYGVAAGGQA